MVFKKMLAALGVGGPSVDTVLAAPSVQPGGKLTGQVNVKGGDHDTVIEYVSLGLVTRVEVESGNSEYSKNMEFHRIHVAGSFTLPAKTTQSLPFTMDIPWETPITSVYGQHLHGMTMGVHTELSVAKAVDKTDLDPLQIQPLPVHAAILDAFLRLGFRFSRADLERGQIYGLHQTLPFYQEIEFYPSSRPEHRAGAARNPVQVRLLGIDAPEMHGADGLAQCWAEAAKAQLLRLAPFGGRLWVAGDMQAQDVYGRYLVYAWTPEDTFVNEKLAEDGAVRELSIPPNFGYEARLHGKIAEAREARRGLWGTCLS